MHNPSNHTTVHPQLDQQITISNNTMTQLEQGSVVGERRECRVCTDDNDQEQNPLSSYCECDGSMKWMHYNCLKQWLTRRLKMKQITEHDRYWECQLCKSRLRVRRQYKRQCRSGQSLSKKITENLIVFVVSLAGIIICIGLLIFCMAMIGIQIDGGYGQSSWTDKGIILATLALGIGLLVFFTYHMVKITVERALVIIPIQPQ